MEMYRCVNCMAEMGREDQLCRSCGFDVKGYVQPYQALGKDTILCGRYLVGRVMGQGGFGITYVGYDLKLGLKVAIKEYFSSGSASRDNRRSNSIQWNFSNAEYQGWQEGKEHFLGEARKMAKLDQVPGIVRVRDSFQENQTAYIVMDFAEGITLKQYLQQYGCLEYRACIELLLPLMDSLEAMHASGLVHRDISPDNLMVEVKGRGIKAKLLDFGAALDMGGRRGAGNVVKSGYSAPEYYMEDGNLGSWSDVYSMAAVIYNCLTGRTVPDVMERIIKPAPLPMEGIRNKKARVILTKALSLKTEDRIRTIAQLRAALAQTIPSGRQMVKWILAVAVAVLGIAGIVIAKPWLPSVKVLGNRNTNLYQGANIAEIPGEYKYFTDADWNLHICPYDKEDKVYYVDETTVVDDEAGFINVGKDKIYFIHDNAQSPGEPDSIWEMNFDGTEAKKLIEEKNCGFMQYVRCSNGKELLYYTTEGDSDKSFYTLCRYDLKKGIKEEVLEDDVIWYNLDDKYIYYTAAIMKEAANNIEWRRAYLDGSDIQVLNDSDLLSVGFIEEETAYLCSLSKEQLLLYNLDGTARENPFGENAGQMFSDNVTYGNGWIYYSPDGTGEIHKIRPDGTGEKMIYDGDKVAYINFAGVNNLWFATGEPTTEQAYLMDINGKSLVTLGDE